MYPIKQTWKYFFSVILVASLLSCDKVDDSLDLNATPSFGEMPIITLAELIDISVESSWTPASDPDGDELVYNLYLNDSLIEEAVPTTSFFIEGMVPDSAYVLSIEADDRRGGKRRIETDFRTEQDYNPSTVQITVNNIGQNTADLSWTEAVDNFNPLTYTIVLNGTELDKIQELTYSLNGLSAGTAYQGIIIVTTPDKGGSIGVRTSQTPFNFTTLP